MQRRRRKKRTAGYDVLWRRGAQAAGLLIACAEWITATVQGRPADQNVLLFAAALIGLPFAAGKGGEK